MNYQWSRPDDASQWLEEYQAWTGTHALKVWASANGVWHGLITEAETWHQQRLTLGLISPQAAMLQVEQAYLTAQTVDTASKADSMVNEINGAG